MRSDARHRQQLAPEKIYRRANRNYRDHGTTAVCARFIRYRNIPAVYISQMYVSTSFGTYLVTPK